jgi:hypothetical protein
MFSMAACFALAVAILPMQGAAAREFSWGTDTPSNGNLPAGFRGMPKHGEFMAAGVACGVRPPEWEARYRTAVEQQIHARARSLEDGATVMRIVDEFAAYARKAVAADQQKRSREYCNWRADKPDMAQGDQIAAGRAAPQ